jgi:hypothetical protein
MKKFLLALSFLIGAATVSVGQTPQQTKTVTKSEKVTKETTKPTLKKDGTPDKRYKENKSTTVVEQPTKKDGTPDMRYKSNKTTSTKKTTKTTTTP